MDSVDDDDNADVDYDEEEENEGGDDVTFQYFGSCPWQGT